jgi:hypothetical protein
LPLQKDSNRRYFLFFYQWETSNETIQTYKVINWWKRQRVERSIKRKKDYNTEEEVWSERKYILKRLFVVSDSRVFLSFLLRWIHFILVEWLQCDYHSNFFLFFSIYIFLCDTNFLWRKFSFNASVQCVVCADRNGVSIT